MRHDRGNIHRNRLYRFCQDNNSFIPCIVTNKHVISGSTAGRFHIHLSPSPDMVPTSHTRFDLSNFEKAWIMHPDSEVDLCVMPIAPLVKWSASKGQNLFFIPLGDDLLLTPEIANDLTAIEDVVMIGYPNGIWDNVNNMPVFRRGITATHPNMDYRGRKALPEEAQR